MKKLLVLTMAATVAVATVATAAVTSQNGFGHIDHVNLLKVEAPKARVFEPIPMEKNGIGYLSDQAIARCNGLTPAQWKVRSPIEKRRMRDEYRNGMTSANDPSGQKKIYYATQKRSVGLARLSWKRLGEKDGDYLAEFFE